MRRSRNLKWIQARKKSTEVKLRLDELESGPKLEREKIS